MKRFAIIESNSGFIFGVVDAENPLAACAALEADIGVDRGEGAYEYAEYETGDIYFVHEVPDGFEVQNGQDQEEINAADLMPRVAACTWVAAD